MGAKPTNTKANAFLAFARNDGASDATIASEIHVSRQRVSILRQQWKRAIATKPESGIDDENATATESKDQVASDSYGKQFPAGQGGARQVASAANASPFAGYPRIVDSNGVALERQRLVDLADEDEQLGVMLDKILRGSAPRAAGIAVGITSQQFGKRMESDANFRDLVLRAAHEAESSVAQNLYRMATGNSPAAAQSAIAWLTARVPDDWSPNRQKIDIEVTGGIGIDVNHILSDPARIKAANAFEMAMQQAESRQLPAPVGDIIEGELIEPRVDPVRPDFPDDEMTRAPDKVEIAPRMNRPGQGDPSKLGRTREVLVDGIRTLMVDERAPGDDDRPPF